MYSSLKQSGVGGSRIDRGGKDDARREREDNIRTIVCCKLMPEELIILTVGPN